jgi:hypothetical protein
MAYVSYDFPKGYDASLPLVIDPWLSSRRLQGIYGRQLGLYGHL